MVCSVRVRDNEEVSEGRIEVGDTDSVSARLGSAQEVYVARPHSAC